MQTWQPKLGYPSQVGYVALMKPSYTQEGNDTSADDRLRMWQMGVIDSSIESLPRLYAYALYQHYLHNKPRNEITQIAEVKLIPIVQRKNLYLI